MTITIDGTTGVSLVQDGIITQPKMSTNVAGNGPCFSAYQSVQQTFSDSVSTKVNFQAKEFDTTEAFDNVTNFRFQPLIAGYYQVNAEVMLTSGAITRLLVQISKNGAEFKRGSDGATIAGAVVALIYLNGSTDYLELFAYQISGASRTAASAAPLNRLTYFQAYLARSA